MTLLPRLKRHSLKTDEDRKARARELSRAWAQANPDKVKRTREQGKDRAKLYRKTYVRKNKGKIDDKRRAYNYKRMYGLTLEQIQELLQAQNGRCAICQCEEWETRYGRLEVDHCHSGGHVRGLLCSKCNTMLGLANDDRDRLLAAISYLDARVKI